MPPKKKVPEGELTSAELRKLIRAHNKLTKITIPKGTDREGIIKIIESNGYKVNHPKKRLDAEVKRGKQISLKKADEILPKPKTKEQKAVEKKARDMKKKEDRDKIKAEGVKQGAAIQRIIDRKQFKKNSINKNKKEEMPTPKKEDIKSQIRAELIKIIKKYKNEDGSKKNNKYDKEGNNPIINNPSALKIMKRGDKFKIITEIKTKELLMDFYNKEIKKIPVLKNNLILSSSNYDKGKKIKPILFPAS